MKIFPVRYHRKDIDESGTYFIVASDAVRAEEIALDCLTHKFNGAEAPEASDRLISPNKSMLSIWVMESWAQDVDFCNEGLIGSGSGILIAKALALYVEKYRSLH